MDHSGESVVSRKELTQWLKANKQQTVREETQDAFIAHDANKDAWPV